MTDTLQQTNSNDMLIHLLLYAMYINSLLQSLYQSALTSATCVLDVAFSSVSEK